MKRAAERGINLRTLGDASVCVALDDYEQLIAASFREHEIPYFVDRRRSAG